MFAFLSHLFPELVSGESAGLTCTGLDLLPRVPLEARVAESLVDQGRTPATREEIAEAVRQIEGEDATAAVVAECVQFMAGFGFLAPSPHAA
ncbi:hypothetical protein ACUY3K_00085 [Corynebacterium uberis]|uniref:hypothetical protein n=1 Tax=Corynebacterium TaxID=1716 RepID=UPI001D0A27F2|nr:MULTISPECIES: hypothetical protein [Corynebacterium]MCZ9309167.1 hypothetical protein [Corynebacterium sp. c6VSa_13]UDL74374.1 hypothetical protein LH391_04025 [Corynebacterium uberis]UDL76792.1 hypothetical protein LH393_05370 [Corynebacterium uberis]UDL79005.1 hypothetical protein LH394_05360 [Corynebacterium uberis]UDL81282.1 hypothetical protein LH392_05780 [Corynebacterium uberis]